MSGIKDDYYKIYMICYKKCFKPRALNKCLSYICIFASVQEALFLFVTQFGEILTRIHKDLVVSIYSIYLCI